MECCVPLCDKTSKNVSRCGRITFHGFPSNACHRAVWLRAIGRPDSHLPDSAVVCSQHFLHDDICAAESGARRLRPGAVPSTVLVCMICLDTDSKMSPISQYNLAEAYEKLTGHTLWDGGNLKQTLCVQCAQQLRNFSRFREQSLRARSLMMELLEKHKLITIQHIKMIQHARNKLKNNLVSTTHRPDPCDTYNVGNTDEDRQTRSEEPVHGVTVKDECIEDSWWDDEDTQRIKESNADCESAVSTCTVCCEQFPHEHAYRAHDTQCGASDNRAPDSIHRTNTELKSCVIKLYDILRYPERAKTKVESSPTLHAVSSHNNAHTACEDAQYHVVSEDEVTATHKEPAAPVLSETEPGTSGYSSRTRTFICEVCRHAFTRKDHLATHMRIHTGEKPYSCELCSYKSIRKSSLACHMRMHTGEKPYSCTFCSYKFKNRSSLVKHIRTHTGEKPYSCTFCSYKFKDRSSLVKHIRTHTAEKPYSCKLCCYKSIQKSNLACHMRTHTGEKPYSCTFCSYKFKDRSSLVKHIRTHTAEKPYSCKLCCYKSIQKSSLACHMRTHTGEKPYSCKLCMYKCAIKSNLTKHMSTHSS